MIYAKEAACAKKIKARTGRIRDVLYLDDDDLYVIYDDPGRIIRLVPAE